MARRDFKPKPLYRKVNTRVRNAHRIHDTGGDFKHERNTKQHDPSSWEEAPTKQGMGKKERRGLDYTPLFRFLLSKVGFSWEPVYKEAKSRIDKPDPIGWMVVNLDWKAEVSGNVGWWKLGSEEIHSYFRAGESTYWSTLYVDEEGYLQKVDHNLVAEKMTPCCSCCTHTLNGVVFSKKTPSV